MMPEDPSSQPSLSDEQLWQLFSVLRQEDEAHAPPFIAEASAQPQHSPRRPGWTLAAACVLATTILAAFLWLRYESPPRTATPDRGSAQAVSITEWRPPTDFLLNTPGREILRTAPVIRSRPYPLSTSSPPNYRPKTPPATTPLSH
jgi:hypothetical protein